MQYYPLFMDLTHATCLVVGAGPVACRKISGLLAAGAQRVRVVALTLSVVAAEETSPPLLAHPAVHCTCRAFQPDDVKGCALVFAATDNPDVNAQVAASCAAQGILCNVADAPKTGTCIVPASVHHKGLHLALTTGGDSPAMLKRIKNDLDDWLTDRYDRQLALLGRVRPLVRALDMPQKERAAIFRQLADAETGCVLERGDSAACARHMAGILPPDLHEYIAELLHELV